MFRLFNTRMELILLIKKEKITRQDIEMSTISVLENVIIRNSLRYLRPRLIEIIDYCVLLIYTKIYVYMFRRLFVSQPVLNKM